MDKRKVILIKNTGILAIGNFSSKLLTFFLVPLYTHYFNPSDYGQVDLYLSILSMMYVFFSFQSIESAFRFIQDCKHQEEKASVISNSLVTALFGITIFTVGIFIINIGLSFQFKIIIILHVMSNILSNLLLQLIRGMNQTILFTLIGMVSTFIQVVSNIIFIVGLGVGTVSLLISPILVNSFVIILIISKTDILKYYKISAVSITVIKEQLRFSLPLLPNALCLWAMSSANRFIILLYYSTTEVGLLTFSLVFPQILGTINSIFLMAWQLSAITHHNDQDKDQFVSEIFNQFTLLQLSSLMVIIPLVKVIIFTLMGKEYLLAWRFVPIFFGGIIFSSYAQFLNSGFYSVKKTSFIFFSTLISTFIYIVFGLILAKYFSILGIGIAYMIAEFVRFLIVRKTVRQYMRIKIEYKKQGLILLLLTNVILFYYFNDNIWNHVFLALVGCLVMIFLNYNLFKKI